jgi:UDP-glucose 4-epimerase
VVRVLVTGGAGFIGSHIVDRLLADGHTVCVVDDLSTGLAANVPKAVEFKKLDICDAAALQDAVQAFNPDIVYHLAAQMDVRRSILEPDFDARVNVLGAMNVLRSAVAAGARRFIYASTGGAVYGNPSQMPVTESQPPEPVSEYGASKLAFEHYLSVYGNRGQIEYAALRFPNVFGPRQRPDGEAGVVAIFTGQMLRGDQAKIFGDGKKTRDYLYVSDIVEANVRAMGGPSGVVANLGWGREVTDLEVFETVAAATQYRKPPVYVPARPGEVERICLDASLARETWGWRPTVTFREGVERVVEHFRCMK